MNIRIYDVMYFPYSLKHPTDRAVILSVFVVCICFSISQNSLMCKNHMETNNHHIQPTGCLVPNEPTLLLNSQRNLQNPDNRTFVLWGDDGNRCSTVPPPDYSVNSILRIVWRVGGTDRLMNCDSLCGTFRGFSWKDLTCLCLEFGHRKSLSSIY